MAQLKHLGTADIFVNSICMELEAIGPYLNDPPPSTVPRLYGDLFVITPRLLLPGINGLY
jgi:hypothetical protein